MCWRIESPSQRDVFEFHEYEHVTVQTIFPPLRRRISRGGGLVRSVFCPAWSWWPRWRDAWWRHAWRRNESPVDGTLAIDESSVDEPPYHEPTVAADEPTIAANDSAVDWRGTAFYRNSWDTSGNGDASGIGIANHPARFRLSFHTSWRFAGRWTRIWAANDTSGAAGG